VQFVVDRRPSKSFLTNVLLPDVSTESLATEPPRNKRRKLKDDGNGRSSSLQDASSAVNIASKKAVHRDDDADPDTEVDGGEQRQDKRQRSDSARDQNFSSAETKISSLAMDSSNERRKFVAKFDKGHKMKKKEKRERQGHVAETVEKVAEALDRDGGTRDSQEQRKKAQKHKSSSTDASSLKTLEKPHVEDQSANPDVLRNESPESVARHRSKKSRKNQPESFDDSLEGKGDRQRSSSAGDYENVDSESTERITVATLSPSSDQKHGHKKRSRTSIEKNIISSPNEAIGEDRSTEWSKTSKVREKTESVASDKVNKSQRKATSESGKEIHGLVESADLHKSSSTDASSLEIQEEAHVENQSTNLDVLMNESPESRHRSKKSRKNRPESFDDDLEGKDDRQCFSSAGDYENSTERTTEVTVSPSSDRKHHHKKRSRASMEKNVISLPSETIGEGQSTAGSEAREDHVKMESLSFDVTSNDEVSKSQSKATSESRGESNSLVESADIRTAESASLFKLVMQVDDTFDKVISGSDDDTRFKIPSTPPRELSAKVATSPRSSGKSLHAAETSVESPWEVGRLSQSCLDPVVISESPVGSPTKPDRCLTDTNIVPSSVDGSPAIPVVPPPIVVLVCIVTGYVC